MKFSKRHWLILAGLLLSAIVALGYFRRDLGTAYVAWQFRSAADAESELDAAMKIKNWIHWTRGYRVTAYDSAGTVIKPHVTKNYAEVEKLEITWDKGTRVERKILNRDSLRYIYGE